MTTTADCLHCGAPIPPKSATGGRPRLYCGEKCRQLAYLARLRERAKCPLDTLALTHLSTVGERLVVERHYAPLGDDDSAPWMVSATVAGETYSAVDVDLTACIEAVEALLAEAALAAS